MEYIFQLCSCSEPQLNTTFMFLVDETSLNKVCWLCERDAIPSGSSDTTHRPPFLQTNSQLFVTIVEHGPPS
jgi:hypothetical protein